MQAVPHVCTLRGVFFWPTLHFNHTLGALQKSAEFVVRHWLKNLTRRGSDIVFGSGLLMASGPSVAVWASLIDRSSAFRPMDFKSMFANNEHLSPQSHKPEHSHQWHISIITGQVVFHHRSGSVERNMSLGWRELLPLGKKKWNPQITLLLKIRCSLCFICSRWRLTWQLEVPILPSVCWSITVVEHLM